MCLVATRLDADVTGVRYTKLDCAFSLPLFPCKMESIVVRRKGDRGFSGRSSLTEARRYAKDSKISYFELSAYDLKKVKPLTSLAHSFVHHVCRR